MNKNLDEKFFDVRTLGRYLQKGVITRQDVQNHLKSLPNDENDFKLVMFEEDDIGLGEELTEEELKSMPEITEDNIDNFDFLEDSANQENSKE